LGAEKYLVSGAQLAFASGFGLAIDADAALGNQDLLLRRRAASRSIWRSVSATLRR
jgi:hypothetical protein